MDNKSFAQLALEQLPRIQRLAERGNALAQDTRRMLFCLDRYWLAYETNYDFERLWWEAFERERGKVEELLAGNWVGSHRKALRHDLSASARWDAEGGDAT